MSMYQLAVNERWVLAEFPAFSQSFEEMLTELTQNVYRAGGSHMILAAASNRGRTPIGIFATSRVFRSKM